MNTVQENAIIAQLTDESLPVRLNALSDLAFADVPSEPLLDSVGQALADADPEVVEKAAVAIGEIGPNAQNVSSRLFLALENKDHITRKAVHTALLRVDFNGWNVIPALMSANQSDDTRHLGAILEVLDERGEAFPELLKPLLLTLQMAKHPLIIAQCAKVLAGYGASAKEAVPVLIAAARGTGADSRSIHGATVRFKRELQKLRERAAQEEQIDSEFSGSVERFESAIGQISAASIACFRSVTGALQQIDSNTYRTSPELSDVRVFDAALVELEEARLGSKRVSCERQPASTADWANGLSNEQFLSEVASRKAGAAELKVAAGSRRFSSNAEVQAITELLSTDATQLAGLVLAERVKPPRRELLPHLIRAVEKGAWVGQQCLAVKAIENLGTLAREAEGPLVRLAEQYPDLAGPYVLRAIRKIKTFGI